MNIWAILKSLTNSYQRKKSFVVSLQIKLVALSYCLEQICNKNDERLSQLVFKIWRFTLLAGVSKKFRSNSLKIMDYGQVIIWAHQH